MHRFSLRSLLGACTLAVLGFAGIYFAFFQEHKVERDIRRFGQLPISDREELFAKVDLLAEIGNQLQSRSSKWSEIPERPELTRVELAQIANHFRELYPFESLESRLAYEMFSPASEVRLSRDAEFVLSQAEDTSPGSLLFLDYLSTRSRALQELHTTLVFDFISQEGVGMSRMRFPSIRDLKIEVAPASALNFADRPKREPGPLVEVASGETTKHVD